MRILVDGYFNLNLGDDLFFHTLFDRCRDSEFLVLAPKCYKACFGQEGNVRVIERNVFWRMEKKVLNAVGLEAVFPISSVCDATVIIGGSIFIEPNLPLRITRKRCPLFIIGTNYGPERTVQYRSKVAKFFSDAADVCVRDRKSYDVFKEASNVRYAPDAIFSVDWLEWAKKYKTENKTFVSVIDLSEKRRPGLRKYKENYEAFIRDLTISHLKERKQVVFASFCRDEGDEDAIVRIIRSMPDQYASKVETLFYRGDCKKILKEIATSNYIIGSRFHSIVLGLAMGKDVVPISYSGKTDAMLKDLRKSSIRMDDLPLEKSIGSISLNEWELRKVQIEAAGQFRRLEEYLEGGKSEVEH